MTEALIYAAVFLSAWGGVAVFERWSRRRRLFDVPNERSSHTRPTPRGGGLVIVVICLIGYAFSTVYLTGNFQWSYLLGASLIALISWLDDLYTVSFGWRFLIHSGAALIVVASLGWFDEIYLPFWGKAEIGFGGAVLLFFWIVWLTNAYNFMDGIDGIAGMQAVTAGIGWLLVGKSEGFGGTGFYGGLMAAAGFGFLIRNWQPAKIFMGDVGSAFLGYSFAVLPLLAKNENGSHFENRPVLLPLAVVLVWLFLFDTLWTFGRRASNGEKVWQAHRGHLYQKLVINGFSHRAVTVFYGLLSLVNVGALLLLSRFLKNQNSSPGIFVVIVLFVLLLTAQSAVLILSVSFSGRYFQIKNRQR